jgi:hypothetical protein
MIKRIKRNNLKEMQVIIYYLDIIPSTSGRSTSTTRGAPKAAKYNAKNK